MVLMGVNRIIVTGGKIRATMAFHIDASERSHEEHASDFDFRAAAAGSFGFGPWSASLSTSVSYVSSSRSSNDGEINVATDLTGEVEIHFKSDYFPVERFALPGNIGAIQANTPNPAGNPLGDTPATGQTVQAPAMPKHEKPATLLPPIGTPLPEAKMPVKPTEPDVKRHVDAPKGSKWAEASPDDKGSPDDKSSSDDKGSGEGKSDKNEKPAEPEKPAENKESVDATPDEKPADKATDKKQGGGKGGKKPAKAAALWTSPGPDYWREVLQ
jgi:hypothetical protein